MNVKGRCEDDGEMRKRTVSPLRNGHVFGKESHVLRFVNIIMVHSEAGKCWNLNPGLKDVFWFCEVL